MKVLVVLLLLVLSCGKDNVTDVPLVGEAGSVSEEKGEGREKAWLVYERAISLGILEVDSVDADLIQEGEQGAHIGNRLVIKDKAMYRYAHGLGLEGSFSFGDDYRMTLNSTFAGRWMLQDLLALSKGGTMRIGFRLKLLKDTDIRNVAVELKAFELGSDIPPESIVVEEVERWRGNDMALSPDRRQLDAELSVETSQLDPHKLNVVEVAHFRDGDGFSRDRYERLFNDRARVYFYTSKGEEVFYIEPGTKIRNVLLSHFGFVAFSVEGELRVLGEDESDMVSPEGIRDISSKMWIQHPAKIVEDDVFEAGEEYIFIFLEASELLRQDFWRSVSEDHRFKEKLALDFGKVGIDYATFALIKKTHSLRDQGGQVRAIYKPVWDSRGGPMRDCGGEVMSMGDSWCPANFRIAESQERQISSGADIPEVANGTLEAAYRNRDGKTILFEVVRGISVEKLEFVNRKRDNLRTEQAGYTGMRGCSFRDLERIEGVWHESVPVGDEFFYTMRLYRRNTDL